MMLGPGVSKPMPQTNTAEVTHLDAPDPDGRFPQKRNICSWPQLKYQLLTIHITEILRAEN